MNKWLTTKNWQTLMIGFVGGFSVIYLLLWLTESTQTLWIMAPFGASCALAFGVSDSPLAQPKNIVGGHFISSFIGLFCQYLGNDSHFFIALAVGLSIVVMLVTKTTHPPAGADPLVIFLSKETLNWQFLFTPVLVGSMIIVVVACLLNNLPKDKKYPKFWFSESK